MVRLNWADPTSREYQYGIDRGVLFVGYGVGVPWDGLISVEENPSGGDAKPVYQDGIKTSNISANEEFEFKIESFSAPKEFVSCDGLVALNYGLFATHQPKKPFGFSYRTSGSNGYDEEFYKIHVVYNAISVSNDNTYESITSTDNPSNNSWICKTLLETHSNVAPFSHIIIDSRTMSPYNYRLIEDIIYGSSSSNSRLPSLHELIELSERSSDHFGYGMGPYGSTSYGSFGSIGYGAGPYGGTTYG